MIHQVSQQEIDLITATYSKEELARKYILATKDCMKAEEEIKTLKKELNKWRRIVIAIKKKRNDQK